VGAVEVAFWAGFVAVEAARAAVEGLLDLDDVADVRQGAEAKAGDSGAVDGGDGGVDGGCEVHGGGVVDVVHGGGAHEGGGLEEGELTGEVGYAGWRRVLGGWNLGGWVLGGWGLGFGFLEDVLGQGFIGGGSKQIDMVVFGYLVYEGHPFLLRVLFGKPDGGWGDGDIWDICFVGLDFCLVLSGGVEAGFGWFFVGDIFYKKLVAVDLVEGGGAGFEGAGFDGRAYDMGDAFGEEAAQGVFVEADGLFCAGEGGEEAGGGEALDVDDLVVVFFADEAAHAPEILQLAFFFIPDQDLVEPGVACEQGFVAFADEEVDLGVGEGLV